MTERLHTVVIGGGQAGLASSYWLTQRGFEHVVLEQSRVGESWRSRRWDSFTLVTPNWALRLSGLPYRGDDRGGFLTRDQTVAYLEEYVALFRPPLRLGVRVLSLAEDPAGGYRVETNQGTLAAANVVVATGTYREPRLPSFGAALSPRIMQVHSMSYRNPAQLAPGGVLVVGSAQSGCQIAEDLYLAGREVALCVGSAGRVPRRYRGRDATEWFEQMGIFATTVDKLPSPEARFAPSVQASGRDGGHTMNLHRFAADGVTLLGHLAGARDQKIHLEPDLKKNLAKADKDAADFCKNVDEYIQKTGLEAPDDPQPQLRAGYDAEVLTELDLGAAGIRTVVWATGYRFDFSWIELPVFDEWGYPVQTRGVTQNQGLYFVGLVWLHSLGSSLLYGVGEDAAHVVEHLATRSGA